MKAEDLCECKHRAELVALRQRVEDQRKELARLNGLVEELRGTFLRQSGACRSAIYRTISDLSLWSRLMEHAEKDFAARSRDGGNQPPGDQPPRLSGVFFSSSSR